MSLTTGIAIYFVIWWITLFAVLPWGVRSQQDSGRVVPGTDPGAPAIPKLIHKLVWTTAVASIIFAIGAFVHMHRLLTLDQLGAWISVRE